MNDKQKKQVYFAFILVALALLIYFLYDVFFNSSIWVKSAFIGIVALGIAIFIMIRSGAILFLEESQRAVISRFGRLDRVGGPGWTLIIPGIESYKVVDLRTQTIEVPRQDVITKDGVVINIDAIIYLKVNKNPQDVVNAIISVDNYINASKQYVIANIRDVAGSLTLEEMITKVNEMNSRLKKELQDLTKNWGVSVDAVELREIKVPDAIVDAMNKQKAAVQQKLATIELAEAEREKINAIHSAASNLSDKSISYYYIKALEEMSKGQSTKIIFPMEFTKIAEILSGKMNPDTKDKRKIDAFIEKYNPLIENYIKEHPEIKLEDGNNETK